MINVIIAGGSGTRLWPLSTPDYPKHLLKIDGDSKSLLQNTYQRAKLVGNQIFVITEQSHAHHIKEQLPELSESSFVVEPARRGTASCIIAALAQIAKQGIDEDEPIAFLHADSYIRDTEGFVHSLKIAEAISKKSKRIVLVGVEPDYPATGFGYIQKDGVFDEENFVFNVDSFKEKPDHDTAVEYLKSGNYLWNCGYFVGSLNTFKHAMKTDAPTMISKYEELISAETQDAYDKIYLGFENSAVDYDLIEKVPDLLVVPAAFDWMDLGSYGDMHKAVSSDDKGNHIHGDQIETESVENSFIQNYEDKPVAVIGLDNIAVINTPKGLLVTRKDMAQQVGEVSKRITNKDS